METQNTPTRRERRQAGRPMGGMILVIVGSILLARQFDLPVPSWLLSWPMIPIAVGLYIGARHSFRAGGWWIPIIVGLFFLFNNEWLDNDFRQFFFPALIITIGLFMIVRPIMRSRSEEEATSVRTDGVPEDYMDSFTLFGGTKRNIFTKNFKGGKVEAFFGGADLNLMQADIQGTAEITFNVAFGGVKLLVPPQWNVRDEIAPILGGVDDKRPIVTDTDSRKTLILKGTVMFGGVDIRSF